MNEQELHEVRKQLKEITSVIDMSSSPFRLVYAAQNFWRFFLYAGVLSVVLPMAYHLILIVFGSYPASPFYMKALFIALTVASWLMLMIIRTKISIRTLKSLDMKGNILKQILSTKLWIAIIPVIVFACVFPVALFEQFEWIRSIPYMGAVAGLVLNIIGVMIHEKEYSIAGYWMIFAGLALFLWNRISGHIAFSFIFAPACFLFVGFALRVKRQKRDNHESN